jgi:hypothetical protein
MSYIYRGISDGFKQINHTANAFADDNTNLTGKTAVTVSQSGTTGVYVTVGQSLFANYNGTAYTAGSTTYNFNAFNGRVYNCADPLLGCAGNGTVAPSGGTGNQAGRIADALIAAGEHTHVIMAPIAVGGTKISQWAVGGNLVRRLEVCLMRLGEQGYTPTAVLLEIGQQDSGDGTTQVAWEASFDSFLTVIRKYTSAPVIVAQCTWAPSSSNATIRAAQAAVVDSVDVFAGPDIDTLTSATYRQAASPHLTATGSAVASLLWRDAIQAVI